MAVGAGSVWVANRLDGTVSRIERGREQIVTIAVGGDPTALAFGGRIAVGRGREGRTGRQIARRRTGSCSGSASATRPRHRRRLRRPLGRLGGGPHGRADRHADGQAARRSRSRRARPRSPRARAACGSPARKRTRGSARAPLRDAVTGIRVGNGPVGIAVGDGAVWIANRSDGTVVADRPGQRVAETVRVGRSRAPSRPATAASGSPTRRTGPSRGSTRRRRRVDRTIDVGSSPARWPSSTARCGRRRSARRDPSRRHPAGQRHGLRARVARPGEPRGRTLSLAYDGLVAYRRAGGSTCGTLVGALARDCPSPARTGGRTSSGCARRSATPTARPSALRTSAPRSSAVAKQPPPRRPVWPTTCRSGASPDRPATLRPLRRDRDRRGRGPSRPPDAARPRFLHKLSQRPRRPRRQPVRRLTRSRCREPGRTWSSATTAAASGLFVAQPALPRLVAGPPRRFRRPDRDGRAPSRRRQIAAVDRGAADVAIARLRARPGRRRSRPATAHGSTPTRPPRSDYVFLNVHAPPFDDPASGARSTTPSTGRVARLAGGPDLAPAHLPAAAAGLPGYTPACPYTVNPSRAGVWIGPDLARPGGSWRRPARAARGSSSGAASRGRGSGGTSRRCCASSAIAASCGPSTTSA